ncbi:CXADR-like membrane protein [Pristis pectinata]|uniref:CXADR-like membrane protein n=1 Tax=Pristis pectinata TaxID=685728 RepID=UPI00223E2118|nr:CXADR-like membrane protein [Pristis pectinata]
MILSSLTLVLMVGYARFWTTIAEKEIKKIEEQDVVLPCQHRFGHLVTKNLDIEWLLQDSEPNQKVVITYSLGSVYENLSAKQRGRISFAADYMMGDASIKISSLQATDSGLYTCKVKNAGEYDWKPAINLVVLVRPSKPKCWTQGQLLQGNDVKLQCRSEKGTEPILYRWERLLDAEGQKAKFQTRSHIDSRTPEMLLLRNLSHTNSGVYQCSATNEAGQESCSVNITVTYAKDPGIIAGAVIGVMLGLLLIFLIVWFTLYRKAKHKYEEEEQPNEIREDAEAPKAKLSSTQSSVGTGSTQSGSCSVKSIRNGTPYSQQPRTPSAKEEKMLISYTSTEEVKINKNGPTQAHMKRMGAVPVMIPAQTKAFQTV